MPRIEPTAFSARWQQEEVGQVKQVEVDSSPPTAREQGTGLDNAPPRVLTPNRKGGTKGAKEPFTPMQLSSPLGSPVNTAKGVKRTDGYGGLTSSAVKLAAAESLLMRRKLGAAGYETVMAIGKDMLSCELCGHML